MVKPTGFIFCIFSLLAVPFAASNALPNPPIGSDEAALTHPVSAVPPAPKALPAGMLLVQVMDDLQQRLQRSTAALKQLPPPTIRPAVAKALRQFYAERSYQPAWITVSGRPKSVVDQLLSALTVAEEHGLRLRFYRTAELSANRRSLQIAYAPTVRQLADFELLATAAFLSYGADLYGGRVNPRSLDRDAILNAPKRDMDMVLRQALFRNSVNEALQQLAPQQPAYQRLRDALANYRNRLAAGERWRSVPDGPKLTPESYGVRVEPLRQRLNSSGNALFYDAPLVAKVRQFQERHGLRPDGEVGANTLAALNVPLPARIRQLALNLERQRWLPRSLGRRYLLSNIPDYSVQMFDAGETVFNTRAIVGRARRPTPLLSGTLTHLVLSPFWYVPQTIAVEDKLPLLRKNPYALRDQGIRIFANNQEIDPGSVDWSGVNEENFSYQLRQNPGPSNALGGVKFMFPNRHAVYLHDTSRPQLFERGQRALSSGCVRIDNPYTLAEYLLRDQPQWNQQTLSVAARQSREQRVNLTEAVPVHLVYWTAWVDAQGVVQFRNDIYRRDAALAKALELF